jgi:hypothetical protein
MQIEHFVSGAYRATSVNFACDVCINLYPEAAEVPGTRTPNWLAPCPGFTPYLTLSPGPSRAMFSQNGRTFAVSGFNFYEINTDGTSTLHGTVAVNANPATICSNGDGGSQLFICSGETGYCFDLGSNTLTTELASGATMCDFLDGYFLVLDAATSTLLISVLYDGTSWDPTQFAQRTQGGDHWVAMKVVHSDIWLLGTQTSEVWSDVGTFPFPFAPRPGAFFQEGCAAPFSLNQLHDTLFWLSQSDQGAGQVMRAEGYAGTRISTFPIEQAIQGYGTIADAQSFTYQQNGHHFFVLTFPSANATWCFDAATGLWHARGQWNPTTFSYDAYPVITHCNPSNNQQLVGNRLTGAIYTLDPAVSTDVDGTGIRRQRRFLIESPNQHYVFYSNLQIYAESGVGLMTGQGRDPQLIIRWSKDGGHQFVGERWCGLGASGQYGFRSMLRGVIGRARNMVFDVVCSDPVPLRLLSASVDVTEGTY